MAIIKVGNFDDIGVKTGTRGVLKRPRGGRTTLALPRSMSLAATRELRRDIDVKGLNLVRSKEPWALMLKRITLHKGFEGFLSGIFNKTNEIYFVTLAWDYSGRRPKVYPYTTLDPAEYVLKMKKGQTYRLHISSMDLQHGFSLQPLNMNFQVLPGYDHVLTITPTSSGVFPIICNEFCGIGHHTMTGRIVVVE